MKKLACVATVGLLGMTCSSHAADLDRKLGLIVSGAVDTWAGVQFIDDERLGEEVVFATGGGGRLSLPLGDRLSIQNDIKYELNQQANNPLAQTLGPRYSYQGAIHLSWRDPTWMLFGAFGGGGAANFGPIGQAEAFFIGGEGQIYFDSMTLYGQGGFVNFTSDDYSPYGLDGGFFARGVLRWFFNSDSRLQLEATYLNSEFGGVEREYDALSFGARYDFSLPGMPLIGDTSVFVAYRGTIRSSCVNEDSNTSDLDDHTLMIGASYAFSGDRLVVDRQGATLDTPDFHHSCWYRPDF